MRDIWLLLKLGANAVTSRSTRDLYDRTAPFYDSLFTEHLQHVHTMVAVLEEQLRGTQRIKVLDVACGTGALSCRLEELGFSTTGVDFSFCSLRRLRNKSAGIRVVQGDATSLPFESASFDVVTCLGAWRHFPDSRGVLQEICRVLRDSGILLVGYFPPKLGGLIAVPDGRLGKAMVLIYRAVIRVLSYDDRVDQQSDREVLRMFESFFAKNRSISSGKHAYLIFAESPHHNQ